ncbi:MAG TPA: thioredoxin domain-containing protein [Gemmatimonadaceae bacterium]|nr:thioredoxin domain-containing protein [Gemmatimonadaceae bacterium]
MPNRLAGESSPYLLQHADNPVDWYPWGADALDRARGERKPILLSIGYAACHWCHVMEHESFEDEETARLMNERFVNIKVDREERPDLDAIYMQAVQAMTGQGGWPMTVFLTPEGVPFYGGTYYPPEDRHGLPSFRRVLRSIADVWTSRQDDVARTADRMRELYAVSTEPVRGSGALSPELLDRAARGLAQQYDHGHGGFGGAPKFPQAMALDFLLRHAHRTGSEPALEMVTHTFRTMARGGVYDQVGGGFHRYAVDAVWLVPHFEKMLYDNALLGRLAVHLHQATGDAEARRVAEETIQWVAREMTAPSGGFHSTLDADSEGHEGKFYLWDEEEVRQLLGDDAPLVIAYWGISPDGNFEGRNILHVPSGVGVAAARTGTTDQEVLAAVDRARAVLYDRRARRVWPARDDKILAAWNGLMLRTVAEAARAFGDDDYRHLALRNGEFLARELVYDGRVLRMPPHGGRRPAGFLEDQAAVALAFLALYELTFDRSWFGRARQIADAMIEWFWSEETGAFFDTASDHEALVTRPREVTDNAVPSGTSLAVELLLRLAELHHDEDLRRRAVWVLETLAEPMARYPVAFGHLLGAADMEVRGAIELALIGDPATGDFGALERAAATTYVPSLVVAGGMPGATNGIGLLEHRTMHDGRATAYVCRRYQCDAPTTEPDTLATQLAEAARRVLPAPG